MRPRADRPVNKSCEVTVPGSPGRGNGENRPSGQPAADNRSGPAVSRKPESDRLLDLEVLRSGDETQAARIAQCITETTMPTPRSWALNRDAEEFAGRAVAPTFVAASAGLVVGDLNTAAASLRPDYATGVGLAAPLETLA